MTEEFAWFSPLKTERHPIVFPGAREQAELLRGRGKPDEAVALLERATKYVEVRGLTAGDRAQLDELKFSATSDGSAEGKLSMGESKLRTVELCLCSWDFEQPLNTEQIRALNPFVLDAIFAVIPSGRLETKTPGESVGANGSGPPPPAAVEPPAQPKEAAAAT